jgi:hypothetical protein
LAALQVEDIRAQEPKFIRLKNRNNLRITGYNLFGGVQSIYSTSRMKEEMQASLLINIFYYHFEKFFKFI